MSWKTNYLLFIAQEQCIANNAAARRTHWRKAKQLKSARIVGAGGVAFTVQKRGVIGVRVLDETIDDSD